MNILYHAICLSVATHGIGLQQLNVTVQIMNVLDNRKYHVPLV